MSSVISTSAISSWATVHIVLVVVDGGIINILEILQYWRIYVFEFQILFLSVTSLDMVSGFSFLGLQCIKKTLYEWFSLNSYLTYFLPLWALCPYLRLSWHA